jgi:hypothetical protein
MNFPTLPLDEALCIQCAEYWLALGEPDAASRELEQISSAASQHPWALRIALVIFTSLAPASVPAA